MNKVADFLYKDITSIHEDTTIRRAIRTMVLHRLSALPVVNEMNEYIGCISESELLNAALPEYMKTMANMSFLANLDQVSNHLSSILDNQIIQYIDMEYPYVSPEDTMSYAADLLYQSQKTILPVLDNKVLIGLLHRIDILAVSLQDTLNGGS